MAVSTALRLPGVTFLPPPRAVLPGFPPLDVAAFVGFAERGPLHTPVPIEDRDVYRAVFGGDLALARDPAGAPVYAHLPTAVAAFFANGGRRCYVVRVAGEDADNTRFRVPGMVALDEKGTPAPATVWAASPGRWSARLRLGTQVRVTPLPPDAFTLSGADAITWATGSAPQALRPGDLLRLTTDDGAQWLVPITGVAAQANATPATPLTLAAGAAWPVVTTLTSPPPAFTGARRLTLDGAEPLQGTVDLVPDADEWMLILDGADADLVVAGDVLCLVQADGPDLLFPVVALDPAGEHHLSPPGRQTMARASALLQLAPEPLPVSPPAALAQVDRLRFDLHLWDGTAKQSPLYEMAFNAGHARFWGERVLLDSSVLQDQAVAETGTRAADAAAKYRSRTAGERIDPAKNGTEDVVALAGLLAPLSKADAALTYLPLGMATLLTEADAIGPDAADVGADDLDTFTAELFLDGGLVPRPELQSSTGRGLLADAFAKVYERGERLRGLHSLLYEDEVALLAVPDAVHRAWEPAPTFTEPAPEPPTPPRPERSRFLDCGLGPDAADAGETAAEPASPPLADDTDPALPALKPLDEFSAEMLLQVQQAMLNVCQARRDVVGIFTLPHHFEKRQCIDWQETLRDALGLPRRRSPITEAGEFADLSYAAVYHPWLLIEDESAPGRGRFIPPDGAVCGLVAARELARQVWIAPANVPMQGVLDLLPAFSDDDWADLLDLQFNLIRPEPRDFRPMSAHTLSDDPALLQLSVRRLMILLRKVAQERGMDYVFAPNDERFREGVQMALEEMLQFMFERGAFAGRTPAQSFHVVTGSSVNTRRSVDQGRFIAEIQVAPSQPMEFITVLLLRLSEGRLQATEA